MSLVFDSGPVISLALNGLLWVLKELKTHYPGNFYIPIGVKKELIDKPLKIPQFKFEAFQVLELFNSGVIKLYRKMGVESKGKELLEIANSIFWAKGHPVKILHRGEYNFILLNAFPYNPGHLLVAPYRHVGQLEDLTDIESVEHFNLVKICVRLLTDVLKPNGFNTGMNLGKIAGAGLADHIHTHIVPRWQGDTNFMPVVGETKVLPEALAATYNKLKEGIQSIL